ncbi:MAG: ATP-dependent DNA helicase [Candidatus Micrarchaeota archaeon]
MPFYFRHDSFRKGQEELAQDSWQAIVGRSMLMAHAPTGMGKTDAVLAAALTHAVEEGSTVLFLTPKTPQHAIALQAARGIMKKHALRFGVTDLVGKARLCLDLKAADGPDFYTVCKRKREKQACPFCEQMKHSRKPAAEHIGRLSAPSHLEVLEESRLLGVCPYELSLEMAKKSKLVIADYNHFFVPSIRSSLLRRMGKRPEDCVVIVDEAHNLASRMRQERSATLRPQWVAKAADEAARTGRHVLCDELRQLSSDLESFLHDRTRRTGESELSKGELLSLVSSAPEMAMQLFECGEAYAEAHEGSGSMSLRIAGFFSVWMASDEDYTRSAVREKGFKCKALDARPLTSIANEALACIAMSGTLLPLEMHRDLLGFETERTALKEYASPFPEENRLNLFVRDVTTRYSRRTGEQYAAIAFKMGKIIGESGGRVAAFFPSFEVMREVTARMDHRVLVQKPEMNAGEAEAMMLRFREEKGVLFAVAGGKLAEGVDYPNEEIKCAVVVGVPVEQKSLEQEALIAYYDKLFGRGWEYAVIFPAVNKALQASGRAVRKESDKAVVVFMDERYGGQPYKKCFPRGFEAVQTNEPWRFIKPFLEGAQY